MKAGPMLTGGERAKPGATLRSDLTDQTQIPISHQFVYFNNEPIQIENNECILKKNVPLIKRIQTPSMM